VANFKWNISEFKRIRNSPGMVALLEAKGEEWVAELNAELREAQAKRRQPIEDGYKYWISRGTRARLHIIAATARAQAHEAEHSSILRLMKVGGTSNVTNPNKGSK
jgi:hypothetical protein